ncbi:hypothetical protein L6452_38598 [Arctium lappa]|uniref:Uncharacterized protein n=1 Tax=Arctium lappa TaxID=4217 RepID=A0ACB8XQ77_ARCLA|nr:hypothetical protein L6452_38598 [Arctium lappa]
MGSQSKPPVLSIEEYSQWKRRMIQFLNHKNRDYMNSIIDGPVQPVVTIPGQAATDTSTEIPVRYVPRPYQYYSEREKELHKIDEEALIYLTMAIPNDIYNRVDSRESAKAMNGMNKTISEINYKFIKNLNPELKSYAIIIQMTKEMELDDVNDIFTTLSQHEDEVKQLNEENKIVKDSLALFSERKKGSSSKSSSSSKYKSRRSRALLTELSDSSSDDSSSEAEKHSDEDVQRFADNIALITK